MRLQGRLIQHGDERLGYPVESLYEKRREQRKTGQGSSYIWSKELDYWQELGFNHSEIDKACGHSKLLVKEQVKVVKDIKCSADHDPWNVNQEQQKLAIMRREGYYLAKLEKVAKARVESKEKPCHPPTITHLTWRDRAVEDEPSRIHLGEILAETRRDSHKIIAWAGADPGICVTLESVPQTTDQLVQHLNRFRALEDNQHLDTTLLEKERNRSDSEIDVVGQKTQKDEPVLDIAVSMEVEPSSQLGPSTGVDSETNEDQHNQETLIDRLSISPLQAKKEKKEASEEPPWNETKARSEYGHPDV
ncbi:hypothetical protein EC968_009378 [Mortierella alpina]|nr:hypothetical protein EC968_009378 [Mortierella alpina]